MKDSFKTAVVNSGATAVYIVLVVLLMTNGERFFGTASGILGGVAILLLFTLSALVVGTLILGKPIMLYLEGSRKEAVKLLFQTIAVLAIITIIFFGVLIVRR